MAWSFLSISSDIGMPRHGYCSVMDMLWRVFRHEYAMTSDLGMFWHRYYFGTSIAPEWGHYSCMGHSYGLGYCSGMGLLLRHGGIALAWGIAPAWVCSGLGALVRIFIVPFWSIPLVSCDIVFIYSCKGIAWSGYTNAILPILLFLMQQSSMAAIEGLLRFTL